MSERMRMVRMILAALTLAAGAAWLTRDASAATYGLWKDGDGNLVCGWKCGSGQQCCSIAPPQ